MFIRKIGIDLGTANILVFVPQKGVVINEPSVVAVSVGDNRILAVGNEAKNMIGRTPDTIIAYRPLKDGVIADYRVTEAMLRYFIDKAAGRIRLIKPEVMISVPASVTSTERRAVIEAATKAGAKAAYVVKEPVLAAIGANIPINEPMPMLEDPLGRHFDHRMRTAAANGGMQEFLQKPPSRHRHFFHVMRMMLPYLELDGRRSGKCAGNGSARG